MVRHSRRKHKSHKNYCRCDSDSKSSENKVLTGVIPHKTINSGFVTVDMVEYKNVEEANDAFDDYNDDIASKIIDDKVFEASMPLNIKVRDIDYIQVSLNLKSNIDQKLYVSMSLIDYRYSGGVWKGVERRTNYAGYDCLVGKYTKVFEKWMLPGKSGKLFLGDTEDKPDDLVKFSLTIVGFSDPITVDPTMHIQIVYK